ncbi:CHAT domain-containing protein [Kribbella sp. CA-245084]|uniref:CHAT domain-containing protein n=1 Tax=Kribbella sp. CA-245084 TaxID=3239940 RepID=UPI003D94FFAB
MGGIWGRGPKASRGRALRFIRGVLSRYERTGDPTELLASEAGVRGAMDHVLRTEWHLPDSAVSHVDAELAVEIGRYYWCWHVLSTDEVERGVAMEFFGLARRADPNALDGLDPEIIARADGDVPPDGDDTADSESASRDSRDGDLLDHDGAPELDGVPDLDEWPAQLAEELLPYAAEHGVEESAAGLVQSLDTLFGDLEPGSGASIASAVAIILAQDSRASRLALDLAIELFYEAAAIAPDPEMRSALAMNIGLTLRTRFEQFGDGGDLNAAIEAGRTAEALAGDNVALRVAALNVTGTALMFRGRSQSDVDDLRESVAALTEACETVAPDDPARSVYLDGLSLAVREHALATHDAAGLDAAVRTGYDAIRDTTPDQQTGPLVNLAATLLRRYDLRRDPEDLDLAIDVHRAALDLLAGDDARRADVVADLGLTYQYRFALFGETSDLAEALTFGAESIEADDDGPARARRLTNYSLSLGKYFEHAGDHRIIFEAMSLARQAVDAVPAGHPDRPRYLHNYVSAYLRGRQDMDRWGQEFGATRPTFDGGELDRAIVAAEESVAGLPQDHSSRPRYSSLLATALLTRYDATADLDDLARAGRVCLDALDAARPDDPVRHRYLVGLANVRVREFRTRADVGAGRGSIELNREIVADRNAPALVRARAGRVWGEVAAELDDWPTALEGFAATVGLLPELVWRGLEHRERRRVLAEVAGLPSQAASAALAVGRPELAIELLEASRGVLLTTPESDPDLADIHRELNNLMESTDDSSGPRRRELARRWDEAMTRAAPQYGELSDAAAGGPVVVINVSRYRCDALAVTSDGLSVVPLATDLADVVRHAQEFNRAAAEPGRLTSRVVVKEVCDWLWTTVAQPTLDALSLDSQARVWWCLTGPTMSLPLHAAGDVPERVISSYTPTVTALIAARRQPERPWQSAVIVGMPQTPTLPDLPHAERELAVARGRLPGAEVLAGPAATREEVLAKLPPADVLHFACHGQQDAAVPGDGRLILADGDLGLLDLIRTGSAPQFAFLSACETARGDASVPDESLHLAGALFLGGCPQVIGTIWPVSDAASVELVADVYDAVPDTDGASALHAAVGKLRRRYPDDPARWASHVHFGA